MNVKVQYTAVALYATKEKIFQPFTFRVLANELY